MKTPRGAPISAAELRRLAEAKLAEANGPSD